MIPTLDRITNRYGQLALMILAKCAGVFKVSFIIGSYAALFSTAHCVTPLLGIFCGKSVMSYFFVVHLLWRLIMYKTVSMSFLAFYIPGLCASLYFVTHSSIIRFFLPALCIVLFVIHPVGGSAFVYSLFWLVPIVLYLFPQRSFFLSALGSTFVAHAVGSVIWLYTVEMTAAMWLALIPIVVVERLFFAIGMVIMHRSVVVMGRVVNKLQQHGLVLNCAQQMHNYNAR